MGNANARFVSWAAREGRVNDLIYHLELTGPDGLEPAPGAEKHRTPLHLAAIGGYTRCISVLFDKGAKLNIQDDDGLTALHHAAHNGHLYVVEMLLQLGANPNIITRFGVAPVHLAASSGHVPMLELLAQHQVDINAQESWGQTPLMIATQKARYNCMKMLLKYGASRNLADRHHGNTALHVACTTRDEETLLIMLDYGADVHAVNFSGRSSLGCAVENKFYRGVLLLVEYGAKPNNKDMEIMSFGLQTYLQEYNASPLSLLRLSRVCTRKVYIPHCQDGSLAETELPDELQQYVNSIRDDCCASDIIKKQSLSGRTVTKALAASTKF